MAAASAQEHALCNEHRNKVRSIGAETLSIAEALALMISFGSFIATLIFGILEAVKENNKK